MNQSYVVAFRSFQDEFKAYKESPSVLSAIMDQSWLNPGARGHRRSMCFATFSTSSSSQHATPSSTASSFSAPKSSSNASTAVEKTLFTDNDDSIDSAGRALVAENDIVSPSVQIPAQRPRKGHKKSRKGCYNCKRRKIKCQETQPECANCTRKNIKCCYPAPKTLSDLQLSASYAPSPVASVTLQSTPTNFTLTDMRLFHHFLMTAYPHLPVGSESTWLCQVPLLAHHNEYLMHAILGLAASHLELTTGAELRSAAIQHRVLAIKGSNTAISKTRRNGADADALLASCYALTFQSAYMRDGLLEFFQMVRGCSLLSEQLRSENIPMVFFLTEKDHFQYMEDKLLDLPAIKKELVDDAEKSLAALPSLFDQPCHSHFYLLLVAVIDELKLGSLGAYFKFVMVYQGILKMEGQMFQEFIDPSNIVARLLIAHFLAIRIIVAPIIDREYAGRARTLHARGHLDWLSMLYSECPPHLRRFLEWTIAVNNCLRDKIELKEEVIPKISISRKKEGLSKAIF